MQDVDYEGLIRRITEVSPAANLCFTTQGYLLNIDEDDATPDAIVNVLLFRLTEDLEQVGITLSAELGEICEQWTYIPDFVELAGMILPTSFVRAVQTDGGFANAIRGILDGGSGLDDNMLVELLMFFQQEGTPYFTKYSEIARRTMPHVVVSSTYSVYLRNVFAEASKVNIREEDTSALFKWLDALSTMQKKFFTATALLTQAGALEDVVATKLEKRVFDHINTVTTSENAYRYAWAYCSRHLKRDNEMTEAEHFFYDSYSREITSGSVLYPQRWAMAKSLIPGTTDCIGMILWRNAHLDESIDASMNEVLTVLKTAHPDFEFSPDVKNALTPLIVKVDDAASSS